MKKIKTIKIPKCPKCKKPMEVSFTTEQDKKSKGKPKVIICFGRCKKCNQVMIIDLIEVDSLPSNSKELMDALEIEKGGEK